MHGTTKRQRNQHIDAALLAYLIIVTAVAATITLIQPKPELMPLLMWYAWHPL
jgi:hypothetical protein